MKGKGNSSSCNPYQEIKPQEPKKPARGFAAGEAEK
jgi:hypothetical protein